MCQKYLINGIIIKVYIKSKTFSGLVYLPGNFSAMVLCEVCVSHLFCVVTMNLATKALITLDPIAPSAGPLGKLPCSCMFKLFSVSGRTSHIMMHEQVCGFMLR